MKKLVITGLVILIFALVTFAPADELRTRVGSYQLIHATVGTATETSPATSDFAIKSSDQTLAFDLMSLSNSVGGVTTGNGLVITVWANALDGDTCTIEYWGIAGNGPLEKICSVACIFGTAQRQTTAHLWVDTVTVTDTHTNTVKTGGSAENGVARVLFDMTGFRFIRPYVTARSNAHTIQIQARAF